jgi:hypothetical protein
LSRERLLLLLILILCATILSIAFYLGFWSQISSFVEFIALLFLIIILGGFLEVEVKPRAFARSTKASADELAKEDDVLLQAVAFSQASLFFLVNLVIKDEQTKLFLSGSTAAFAGSFYALRAWGKIKNDSRYRYYSMYVLALVLGNSVFALMATLTNLLVPISSLPFFPNLLLILTFFSMLGKSTRDIIQSAFRKRYGLEGD